MTYERYRSYHRRKNTKSWDPRYFAKSSHWDIIWWALVDTRSTSQSWEWTISCGEIIKSLKIRWVNSLWSYWVRIRRQWAQFSQLCEQELEILREEIFASCMVFGRANRDNFCLAKIFRYTIHRHRYAVTLYRNKTGKYWPYQLLLKQLLLNMYSYHTLRISWLHILAEKQLGHISQCINFLPHRANACLHLLS